MSGIGRRNGWTLGIVSVALFMVVLDNLVVSVALPTIHRDLGASIQSLEWTVNAYVLAYAVLLLTGAALGDRFGRKRMFLTGLGVFTAASARRRARAQHRPPGRRARRAGSRRGDGHSAHADAAGRGLPGGETRYRHRRVVGGQRHRRRARPARRRRRRAEPSPGTGSSGSTCPIGIVLAPLAARWLKREPRPLRHARPARPRARLDRRLRRRLRPRARADARLDAAPPILASHRPRHRPAGRVRRLGAAHHRADAADVLLRQALLRRHQRRLAEHVLRHVRFDLLPLPVHAKRSRQHAPAGRPEAAGVDRRHHGRRALRRHLLRAPRQPPVHGRRPDPAGRRARLAGAHRHHTPAPTRR